MKLDSLQPKIRFEKKWPDVVAGVLHIALFIFGGVIIARWLWLLFSPADLALPPALEQPVSNQSSTILSGHWFGATSKRVSMGMAAHSTVNFKLMGVYASTGSKEGFAIFKMPDGKQRSVLLHEEITPEIHLQSIETEAVKVGQEGNLQTLTLENHKQQSTTKPALPSGFHL